MNYNNTAIRVRFNPDGTPDQKHVNQIIAFYESKGYKWLNGTIWVKKEKSDVNIGTYKKILGWWPVNKKIKEIKLPNTIPTPNTSKTEILYELIHKGYVSCETFQWMEGLRARISEIKAEIRLKTERKAFKNKWGRPYTISVHKMVNKKETIKYYKSLFKK